MSTFIECVKAVSVVLSAAVNGLRFKNMTASFWPRAAARLLPCHYGPSHLVYLVVRIEPGRLPFTVSKIRIPNASIRQFSEKPSKRPITGNDLKIVEDRAFLTYEELRTNWPIGTISDGAIPEEMLFLIETPLVDSMEPFRLPIELKSPIPFVSLLALAGSGV